MKYVLQHNVCYTTVPTRDGKEYLLPTGRRNWSGAKSHAKKFPSKQAAMDYAETLEMGTSDYLVVEGNV